MATIRDIRKHPFYWIDTVFLDCYGADLGPVAIAVYNALCRRADRTGASYPGASDMMRLTGIKSRHTLRKAVHRLEALGLVSIQQRYTPMGDFDTSIYTLLPIEVGQEMPQGRANFAPGVEQILPQGRANFAQELDPINNIHATTWEKPNNKLAAAAASLLERFKVQLNQNDDPLNIAAALIYTMTQPGLKNPVGFVMKQKGYSYPPEYEELANVDLDWQSMLNAAKSEYTYRQTPGIQGLVLCDELAEISDGAISILNEIANTERK